MGIVVSSEVFEANQVLIDQYADACLEHEIAKYNRDLFAGGYRQSEFASRVVGLLGQEVRYTMAVCDGLGTKILTFAYAQENGLDGDDYWRKVEEYAASKVKAYFTRFVR